MLLQGRGRVVNGVVLVALLTALCLGLLAVGMHAALQENRLFWMFVAAKRLVIPAALPDLPGHVRINEYGQLVHYQDKQRTARPYITSRTIVAFVFGQSNSANHGGERFASTDGKVYNYFDGHYYVAVDPLLGATGYYGSVWTLLGNKLLAADMADKVILIPAGVGGTSVRQWQEGGWLHGMLRRRLADARASGLVVTHFLWHQGEADQGLNPAEYADGLNQVIKVARGYFPGAKFFVAQASRCDTKPSAPSLLDVQRSVASQPGVFLGPDTDVIGPEDRYDDCHFSGRGQERHADGWLRALQAEDSAD